MKEVIDLLSELDFTISTCESLTGGKFVEKLVSIPGASKNVKGGIVTYTNEIKTDVVGVLSSTVEKYGVVSEEVALEMAQKTNILMNTDVCISFTGNAGPDTLEGKSVGLVYSTIDIQGMPYKYCLELTGSREEIREHAVSIIKEKCIELLKEKSKRIGNIVEEAKENG